MKKFLTVLLALSVVFTYSFSAVGTVFAVTDEGTFNGNVNQAQAQVTETLNSSYNNVVKNITAAEYDTGYTASKAAWTAAAQLIKDKQLAAITARTNEIKGKYADLQDLTVNEIVALYSEAKGDDTKNDFASDAPVLVQGDLNDALYANDDVKDAVARADFAEKKAEALNAVDKINLSIYSTTVDKVTKKSGYDLAKEKIAEIKKEINAVTIAANADVSAVKTALGKIGATETVTYNTATGEYGTETATVDAGALKDVVKIVDSTDANVVIGYKLANALNYLTTAKEEADATTLAAKKAAYLSRVNANAAQYLASNATATGDTAAKVKAEKDAYVAGMTAIINAVTTDAELSAIATSTDTIAVPTTDFFYTANAVKISDLETVAAKYKAYKDADGNTVKDADAIDKIVADAKVAAYKTNAAWSGYDAAEAEIKSDATNAAAAVSKEVIELEKADIEKGRAEALAEGYYAPEEAKVNALFDKLIAAVDAAKTATEVQDVYTNNNAVVGLDEIYTKEDLLDEIKAMAGFTTNKTALEAYKTMLNAGFTSADAGYRDFTAYDDNFFADLYASNGARTTEKVAALLNTAKAVLDAAKTKGQIAADKKAVEDKIAALPATITTANAAAVTAAFDAAVAYNKDANKTMDNTDIANIATLKLAISALAKAEKKEITDAIAKLPANVTSADKENIKTLVAKEKAFNEKCDTGKIYEGVTRFTDAEITTLTDKLVTIRGQELAAVKKAIDAIPFNVTEAHKALVETARALYDAYVAEYTDYTAPAPSGEYNQNAAKDIPDAKFKELADAEATLAALEKDAVEKIIKAVESFKIKVTTKRYTGSKMRINWTTTGDESAIDGYRVYYSTKKSNSGYKYLTKTTKKYINHTSIKKNVKKGTRVYYRVRAYVEIDGVRYFSDYSTVGNRIWK